MDELLKTLKKLVPALGEAGVEMLADQLKDLIAQADTPWKKAALKLVANAVEEFGPDGINIAINEIEKLFSDDDDKIPEIDWADLEVASDLLAQFQNAEADQKTATRDFLAKLSETMGVILQGLIKGLING